MSAKIQFDNEEYYILFGSDNNDIDTAKNKAEAFDKIAAMFYNVNFGSAPKSEIDLLMFSIYMDKMIEKNVSDGVLDYVKCSDFNIAKQLGMTQERIRTFKLKKQARYPEEFDWQKSLERLKGNIRYDERKQKIIIPTPDPNLYNEIRNFIEEKGGYIDIQRGSNYIQIRPEYYILLFYDTLDENNQKKFMKEIEQEFHAINKETSFKSLESREERVNHILGIVENGLGTVSNGLGVLDKVLCKFDAPLGRIGHELFKKFAEVKGEVYV